MAHQVTFEVPKRPLEVADLEVKVKRDKRTLGTLKISKGTVVWFPRSTTYGHRMRWEKFDRLMKEHATRFERRRWKR